MKKVTMFLVKVTMYKQVKNNFKFLSFIYLGQVQCPAVAQESTNCLIFK